MYNKNIQSLTYPNSSTARAPRSIWWAWLTIWLGLGTRGTGKRSKTPRDPRFPYPERWSPSIQNPPSPPPLWQGLDRDRARKPERIKWKLYIVEPRMSWDLVICTDIGTLCLGFRSSNQRSSFSGLFVCRPYLVFWGHVDFDWRSFISRKVSIISLV